MYEWNEEEKEDRLLHNPFSMPQGGLKALEAAKSTEDYLKIKAISTTSSATVSSWPRAASATHEPDTMIKAFRIAGLGPEGGGGALRRHVSARSSTARRRTAAWRPASTAW
jgi:aspartyl-tRNA synthetase